MKIASFTLFLLCIWVLATWSACPCFARILKVPSEFQTIESAVSMAANGDVIQIAQGEYEGRIVLKPGLVLQGGWNKEFSKRDIMAFKTILVKGQGTGWVIKGAEGCILDGIVITQGKSAQKDDLKGGAGVLCEGVSFTLRNCIVKQNQGAGIYCDHGDLTVENSSITSNQGPGIYIINGAVLRVSGSLICLNKKAGIGTGKGGASRFVIRQNLICQNGMEGIEAKFASGDIFNNIIYENKDAGVRCVLVPTSIVNNTIIGNTRSGITLEDQKAQPLIRNNIIAHNMESGIRAAGKGYAYNLLFDNSMTGDCDPAYLWCIRRQYGGFEDEKSYLTHHDVIADPLFEDPVHHDFHLRPGSPAIDRGDPDTRFNDRYFPPSKGTERNDLGAYGGPFAIISDEFGAGSSVLKKEEFKVQEVKGAKKKLEKEGKRPTEEKALGSEALNNVQVSGNLPPIAHAGQMINDAYLGDTVTLFGGASKDPDGDPLTYHWSITFRPEGSQATLSDPESVSPSLVVDALGCFAVELVVSDGKSNSRPDALYICTTNRALDGIRRVPQEYPTIQTAIDSADPGDKILVQKGRYRENIVIDKNVDLVGVDWPVIDGGSKQGDVNTIMVAYLGKMAGKIHGFVITGGGNGHLGHGINIWDSSPEIYDNQIVNNGHVGIGIHGRGVLTSKTRIHDNIIHDNLIGIGNGRNSSAHIYSNHIYNNKISGIGCMGLAAPLIQGNIIHDNFIGIGCREVSSPVVRDNHIFDNVCGIVISPVSTIRRFPGKQILIQNNLIIHNFQTGISVSSLNLSKIIIKNNTIDSNNLTYEKKEMAGGIVLGYPTPGAFQVILENNIVTNNHTAGIINYQGTELFPSKGAEVFSSHNDFWNNKKDLIGLEPGPGDISKDPLFVSKGNGKTKGYYLSQKAAGQLQNSPCVDAGKQDVKELGLSQATTRTDGHYDTGMVDMGYHYQRGAKELDLNQGLSYK